MAVTDRPQQDPKNIFAAERTLLAWIRTGLGLMGLGFVVARFGLFLREVALLQGLSLPTSGSSRWFGASLIVSGVLVIIGSLAVHVRTVQRLKRGEPYLGQPAWLAVATAAFLAAGGVVLALYLIV